MKGVILNTRYENILIESKRLLNFKLFFIFSKKEKEDLK